MQDSENKKKGTDDWMFDNPFMNKVPTKGGGYKVMARQTSIIPALFPVEIISYGYK